MDRRGRGSSGDAGVHELTSEYADVATVAAALADEEGGPVDVVGHSIGATCVLGAAALGAPFRRIALYEPPGPQATQNKWPERVSTMVADGQAGRATFTFLTEIVGLTRSEVEVLRDAPGGRDVLSIVAATLPREAARSPPPTWSAPPARSGSRCCCSARPARLGLARSRGSLPPHSQRQP